MNAIVILNKRCGTLIYTPVNNIDWVDKQIIDSTDIIEQEYVLNDTIQVFDIEKNLSDNVRVNDLDTSKHQLIIDKKRFVTLHILK